MNNAATNLSADIPLNIDFSFFGYIPRCEIAGSYGSFIFSFLRSLYTVLYDGYTNLQYQQ
jgi:hypothetical protein